MREVTKFSLKFRFVTRQFHEFFKECYEKAYLIFVTSTLGTFCLVDACLERMQRTKRPLSRLQIIESLVRMRAMRGGLVQTPDQLRFSLQAIEDAMKDIEFVEENGNGNADTNGSSLNNGSTTGNRKRSTDDIMDEEAVINNAENVANSAPKRPKANC
jgi:hypothetical protein